WWRVESSAPIGVPATSNPRLGATSAMRFHICQPTPPGRCRPLQGETRRWIRARLSQSPQLPLLGAYPGIIAGFPARLSDCRIETETYCGFSVCDPQLPNRSQGLKPCGQPLAQFCANDCEAKEPG